MEGGTNMSLELSIADKLSMLRLYEWQGFSFPVKPADFHIEAATMLRQQQEKLTKYELRHVAQRDRIAILEMQHKQQQAEIEALKAKYEPKPLTKEQEQAVLDIWKQVQPHLFKEKK